MRSCKIVFFAAAAVLIASCTSIATESYYPSAQLRQNDSLQITDEDIRNAFNANPQLVFPLRIAWYDLGTDEIVARIDITEHEVASSYVIPKTLIEGFGAGSDPWRFRSPRTLNLDAVRLAAARSQSDILIVVGSRMEITRRMNGLAVFNVLIVPVVFNPAFGFELEYSTELYVFDVRNAYLYGDLRYRSEPLQRGFLTLGAREQLIDELSEEAQAEAGRVLSEELNTLFARYRNE